MKTETVKDSTLLVAGFMVSLGLGFLIVSHLAHTVFASSSSSETLGYYEPGVEPEASPTNPADSSFLAYTTAQLAQSESFDSGGCGCPACCSIL